MAVAQWSSEPSAASRHAFNMERVTGMGGPWQRLPLSQEPQRILNLLLWTSIEYAVSKCSETDGGVVVSPRSVVDMHFQQADFIPYWRRDRSDKQ